MLAAIRDVAAVLFLEDRLGLLREKFLFQAINGQPYDPDYWAAGEQAVIEQMKQDFYNRKVRLLVMPDNSEIDDDEQDFSQRTQKIAEQAILATHRKLVAIPYVGHPEYSEK